MHKMMMLGLLALAGPADAALVAGFELNGSLANAAGNTVTLTNNGGVLGATGISFAANNGPTVTGLSALPNYTIDIGFTLDTVSGYRKLIDFSNRASDSGYYNNNGFLNAFPLGNSPNQVFSAGTPVRLTLSRTSAGLITAYIDGTEIYARTDVNNGSQTAITGLQPLNFFRDDFAFGPGESTSGFVDFIRIFDTAITPQQAEPSAVPEPATWAMMLFGFGALGHMLRRQTRTKARVRFA